MTENITIELYMIDPRIRLRHLRCFLETARLGKLSAAAASMNVSQPAASKTLRELEEILQKPLFDRSHRRLTLTTAGRVFQQHAGEAMVALNRAETLVRDAPATRVRLAVGVLPTAATSLMPRAALSFQRAFPNCKLRVSTGPNWLLMSQLREGSLDLVVGRMASAEVMATLAFHPLYSEDISAVVRPEHPLSGDADAMQKIKSFPLIVPPPGAVIAPMVRALLARYALSSDLAGMETVSLAFGRAVVRDSDAVWFISRGVVQDELDAGSLALLPIETGQQGGPVGVSMRLDGPLSTEQQSLVDALQEAGDTLVRA